VDEQIDAEKLINQLLSRIVHLELENAKMQVLISNYQNKESDNGL